MSGFTAPKSIVLQYRTVFPRIILFALYRLAISSHTLGSVVESQPVLTAEISPFGVERFETTRPLVPGLVQLEHQRRRSDSQTIENLLHGTLVIGPEWS